MRARIEQELALLRQYYPDVEHSHIAGEDWFRIPRYCFPPGWCIDSEPVSTAPIAFKIVAAYPAGEPYGFFTPAKANFNGQAPNNAAPASGVPFGGDWHHFSWAPDGWSPTNEVRMGSNLLVWVRSFAQRLAEGA